MKQLHDTRKKLKDFAHLNKKALDQYIFFKDRREELFKRKEDLDEIEKVASPS